jgi:hypothetical protein
VVLLFHSFSELFSTPRILPCFLDLSFDIRPWLPSSWANSGVDVVAVLALVFPPAEAVPGWLVCKLRFLVIAAVFLGVGLSISCTVVSNSERGAKGPKG